MERIITASSTTSVQYRGAAKEFIGTDQITFGGNDFELYFEEEDFDQFAEKLKKCNATYVHPVKEHS